MNILDKWNSNFLIIDSFLTMALVGPFAIWTLWLGGHDQVSDFLCGIRTTVYRTIITAGATLLGLSLAAVSVVFGLSSNERLQLLSQNHFYLKLWQTLFQTIRLIGVLTIVAFAGLILDRDSSPVPVIFILTAALLVISGFRLGRSIWIVEQLIKVVIASYQTSPTSDELSSSDHNSKSTK